MSQAIKCDRCGKFEETTIHQIHLEQVTITTMGNRHVWPMELCKACVELFQEWLKG